MKIAEMTNPYELITKMQLEGDFIKQENVIELMQKYAQEQVKSLSINDVRLCFPTDEAIEDIAEASYPSLGGYHDTSYHERRGFEEGAEWVINMIKNSEKWEK